MDEVSQKSPAQIVASLREMIRAGKPDQWIGMQARLLIEPGTTWRDTGSQAGFDPGTAWERHDDPEQK